MSRLVMLGAVLTPLLVAAVGCGERLDVSPSVSVVGDSPATADKDMGVQRAGGPAAKADAPPSIGNVKRRIIETATLEILVKDFDKARDDFHRLVAAYDGYIAKSDFQGSIGKRRSGTWTVRVPVEKFHAFLNDVLTLGQPVRHTTQADDVTEEWIDTEALLRSLKEEEEALNRLMKEKAQTLNDVAIWKEKVALVRREINRLEARMQTLSRLTSLGTVHVTLRDDTAYIPATDPPYEATAKGTFEASTRALQRFGRWLFLVSVAVAPWLLAVAPFILLMVLAWRRRRARVQRPPALPSK